MNGWNEINTIEKSKLPQQRSNALFDNQMYDNSEEWGELSVEDPSIYTPTMVALRDGSQLGTMVDFSNVALGVMATWHFLHQIIYLLHKKLIHRNCNYFFA